MYLIIDTATIRGLVALASGSTAVSQRDLVQSQDLEASLSSLLKEANIAPSALEYVAVGCGPGSYTGIRCAVASAKALSLGLGIPLVSLSSLQGFCPPDEYEGQFLTAFDAKIGGVYCIEGSQEGGIATFIGRELLEPIEAFREHVRKVPCLVTASYKPLEVRIAPFAPLQVFEMGPKPSALALQADRLFGQKRYSLDGSCELMYLRLTQAEMEKLPNKPTFG